METKDRELKTVMHELKKRTLTVKRIEKLTPSLKRITFAGDELSDFVSLSPDDHVKVFFPAPNGSPADAPPMRDYTPRRYDRSTKELDIEFFLHADGPGSNWAKQAEVGQTLMIGGPRGSKIVPYHFDWYLMIGDETAIPSIARRLSELPVESKSFVLIEVEDLTQTVRLEAGGASSVKWIYREGREAGDANRFIQALQAFRLPEGDFFTWIAAEKSCAFAIKEYLVNEKRAQPQWMKTAGYWIKGKTQS